MNDQDTCCGKHRGRLRVALADERRAASTIARAQGDGRRITEAMTKALESGKRGVEFARQNIEDHQAREAAA